MLPAVSVTLAKQDELLGLSGATEWRDLAQYSDPEVLFRRGETPQGQPTYTPRLLLFDLCGALGGGPAPCFLSGLLP